jgi:hypothetical protein
MRGKESLSAMSSAVIYSMLLSKYGAGPLGMDETDAALREKYFANLGDLALGPEAERPDLAEC